MLCTVLQPHVPNGPALQQVWAGAGIPLLCCSLAAWMLAWGQWLALLKTSDAGHVALQELM